MVDISDDDAKEDHPNGNDVVDVQKEVVNEPTDGQEENMQIVVEPENGELQNLPLEQLVKVVEEYIGSKVNTKDWALDNIVYVHYGVDERAALPREVWRKIWFFLFTTISRLPLEEFGQIDIDFSAYGHDRGIIG